NPTHGSGWIVQVQPTDEGRSATSLNSTHGSGWIVQVQPTDEGRSATSFNPTHGSGWIVQVQPTDEGRSATSFNPTHGSGWDSKKSSSRLPCRLGLNGPPTSVGGIPRFFFKKSLLITDIP